MAQLLLIKAETVRVGVANLNGLVGVFESSHVFSPAEVAGFRIVAVAGYTKEQIDTALYAVIRQKLINAGLTRPLVKYPVNLSNEGAPLLVNKFTIVVQ